MPVNIVFVRVMGTSDNLVPFCPTFVPSHTGINKTCVCNNYTSSLRLSRGFAKKTSQTCGTAEAQRFGPTCLYSIFKEQADRERDRRAHRSWHRRAIESKTNQLCNSRSHTNRRCPIGIRSDQLLSSFGLFYDLVIWIDLSQGIESF